jgi:hypothetical protein
MHYVRKEDAKKDSITEMETAIIVVYGKMDVQNALIKSKKTGLMEILYAKNVKVIII